MKNKIKIIIDIIMTILFIILMGYFITGNKIHEILGTITFILFIIHNILNINWYKNIFKGKYNIQRTLHLIINLLLLLAMLGIIISGIMISANVFSFLNIPTTMIGRKLHMLSTSWGFILMAIHIGLHITGIINKISTKMKKSIFEYVYYFIVLILSGFGIYSFITLKLWEEMFLINQFNFFDYGQSPIIYYLKYIGIILVIEFIIYYILKLINNKKRKKTNHIINKTEELKK